MLFIMSSVIYDQKQGHVLLILMGKIWINGQEFTLTNAARYHLRAVLGFRVYASIVRQTESLEALGRYSLWINEIWEVWRSYRSRLANQ